MSKKRRIPEGGDVEIHLEGVELRSEGVATHGDVQATERLLSLDAVEHGVREHDEPGTGSPHRQTAADRLFQRLCEIEQARQFVHHRRLTARDDQAVHLLQLGRSTDADRIRAERTQNREMFAEITLQGEDADPTSHARRAGAVRAGRRR